MEQLSDEELNYIAGLLNGDEIMQIAKITSVILAYIKDKEEQQQIKNN